MSVNSKMTALADEIRELSGTSEAIGLDAMTNYVDEANTDVATEAGLIAQIASALEGKAGGGSGNMERCFVTLYGGGPTSGNEQIWYIDGSSSPKSINFPSLNNITTITVLKNSILCSYNISTVPSGNISRCISTDWLKVFFVSGNASMTSM